MSDEIVALAKLAARQAHIINLLSMQLADQACLLSLGLKPCSKCAVEPTTVEHVHMKLSLCDRCAAEAIVASGRTYVDSSVNDGNDPLNDVRSSLMNDGDWLDVPDADRIRRLMDYVKIIKQLDIDIEQVQ